MADHDRVRLSQGPDQPGGVSGGGDQVVAAGRLVAPAVAPQVHRHGAETCLGQPGQLVPPRPPELGKAVHQKHQRPVAGFGDMEPGPVGAHRPVCPRAADLDRGLRVHGHRGRLTGARGRRSRPAGRRGLSSRADPRCRCWAALAVAAQHARAPQRPTSWSGSGRTDAAGPGTRFPPPAAASTTQVPAAMRNAAQGQMPRAIRPKAKAMLSSTSTRQLTNAAKAASAPARPTRRISALNSVLARSISYLISCDASLAAKATRSPSDWSASTGSGVSLRTIVSLSRYAGRCPISRSRQPGGLPR